MILKKEWGYIVYMANGIKDRTLSEMLKAFIEKRLIIKVSHGVYSKT